MNRGYTRDEYEEKISKLKRRCPDIAITTDCIVGFPGEDEGDFRLTMELVERTRFDGIFSFCFSPRKGTTASALPDRVPEEVARGRLRELQAVQKGITREIFEGMEGEKVEVLVERFSKNSREELTGRTRTNRIVNFRGPGQHEGQADRSGDRKRVRQFPSRRGRLRLRRHNMLKEMKVAGITVDPFTNTPIVILKDLEEQEVLPIWIGLLEASSIATALENVQTPRPMTHDLLKNVLDKLDARVVKIEVNDLKDNTYFAMIHLEVENRRLVIDARPSDAIALALRVGATIFVDEQVIKKSAKVELVEERGQGGRRYTGMGRDPRKPLARRFRQIQNVRIAGGGEGMKLSIDASIRRVPFYPKAALYGADAGWVRLSSNENPYPPSPAGGRGR